MTRRAGVEVVGDARSYLRMLKESGRATGAFGTQLKELATDAKASAEKQVQAAVKRDARLREQITAYKELAAVQKKGSREQIAANRLLADSEARLAHATSTTVKEQKALASSATHAARSIKHAEFEAGKFTRGALAGSGAFRAMGRSLAFASAGFLTFAGASQLVRESVSAAGDLEQAVRAAGQTFQDQAKGIKVWAEELPAALGMTVAEGIKATTVFGRMLGPLGVSRIAAAGMSETLVKLAGDLSAFSGTPVNKVLIALRSGLAAMPRPMRQFGVFLTQDRLEAEALSAGLIKANVDMGKVRDAQGRIALAVGALGAARARYGVQSVEAAKAQLTLNAAERFEQTLLKGKMPVMTQLQKTMAAYRLILKDTAAIQGFATRTGDTWAGQVRKWHTTIGNFQETLGTMMLPTFTRWLGEINAWLGVSSNQKEVIKAMRDAVHGLGVAFGVARSLIGPLISGLQGLAGMLGGWKTMLELAAGAWVGFKVAGVTAGVAVEVANVAAAAGTAAAWRAALVATGWGAFAVAAGAAAAYVMTHWKQTEVFFKKFWIEWQIFADEAVLNIIEIFSHIPRYLGGGWAQDMKSSLKATLDDLQTQLEDFYVGQHQAAQQAAAAGGPGTAGKIMGFVNQITDQIDQQVQQAQMLAAIYGALGAGSRGSGKAGPHKETPEQRAARLEAQRAAAQARQFRFLGLDASGQSVPTAAGLQKELGTLAAGIKGTFLDTAAQRSQLDKLRQLLSGKFGTLGSEVKGKIKNMLDDLKTQLKQWTDDLKAKTDEVRGTLGALFSGPVMQPSEEQIKHMLGVPGPTLDKMIRDLKGQTSQFVEFERDLRKLQARGAPKQLIEELRQQGTAALPEIRSLVGGSKGQLNEFFAAFRARERQVQKEANIEMRAKQVNINASNVALGGAGTGATKKMFELGGPNPGLLKPGNIDLLHRKVAHLANGMIATVKSFSIGMDGKEVLLPQVINGHLVSMAKAIAWYKKTGQNLGTFSSVQAANAYAVRLHNQQAAYYGEGTMKGAKAVIVIPVYLDGKLIATNTTHHQQRKRKKTAAQVRGRHPGDSLAVN